MTTIANWWHAVLQQLLSRDPHDPYADLRRELDERTLRDIGLDG
jgi:hypothetical protein